MISDKRGCAPATMRKLTIWLFDEKNISIASAWGKAYPDESIGQNLPLSDALRTKL